MDRDRTKWGNRIADRLLRLQSATPVGDALAVYAEHVQFFDEGVRLRLSRALFHYAKFHRETGSELILWSCMRRAASMTPDTHVSPIIELIDAGPEVRTRQCGFQCISNVFSVKRPPAGPDSDRARARVSHWADRYLRSDWLGEWGGEKTALAGTAAVAAISLGCLRTDEFLDRIHALEKVHNDGSVSTLHRFVLRHLFGRVELTRPDLRPAISKLTEMAKEKKREPFDSVTVQERQWALDWAKKWRPETLEDIPWSGPPQPEV